METNTGIVEQDPLAEAAEGVAPPKYPVLAPDRICRFRISKCEKASMKDDATRFNLVVQLKTTKDYTDKDGSPLREGFTQTKYHPLTPVAERTIEGKTKKAIKIEDIKADLCVLLRAAGHGQATARQLYDNPAMIKGSIVDCKVGINKERDGFPESNSLKYIDPANEKK